MKTFGLIGKSLAHSFSPAYFTEKFTREGLTNVQYKAFELQAIHELPQLILDNPDLMGLNVTIPFKEDVIRYVNKLDPFAAEIGAVNTLRIARTEERIDIFGYNTDIVGFGKSLLADGPVAHTQALVLGNGGASKAIQYLLAVTGFRYQVVSRQPHEHELSYAALTPELIHEHTLIINTTPLGTYPNIHEAPAIPYEALTQAHLLYDLVYNPAETLFLQKGKAAGAQTMNGLAMLEIQAEESWKIWNS